MKLATINANKRGAVDTLLIQVADRLTNDGLKLLGALSSDEYSNPHKECNCALNLLPDGPVVRITQDLGDGSTACQMDAGAMADAVGIAETRFDDQVADFVLLNKFGLQEAKGGGFRSLISKAVEHDVPVLLGLSETHKAAFEQFTDSMAIALPTEEEAVVSWCWDVIRSCPTPAQ